MSKKKELTEFEKNFLVRTLQSFQKKFNCFFPHKKLKKTTLKSCSEKLKSTFFFITARAAQTAQTEDFMFQNVVYRATVYRTGVLVKDQNFVLHLLTRVIFNVLSFLKICLVFNLQF